MADALKTRLRERGVRYTSKPAQHRSRVAIRERMVMTEQRIAALDIAKSISLIASGLISINTDGATGSYCMEIGV